MSVMRDKFRPPAEEVCQELRPLLADGHGVHDAVLGSALLSAMTGRPLSGYEVERRIYGYLIRRIERMPRRIVLVQVVGWIAGAGMCIVSADLLRRSDVGAGAGLWGTAVIVCAVLAAIIALRFATRGTLPHVEVDLKRGELREMMSHRIGRETLLQCIGFDAVKALRVLPRTGQAGVVQELTLYCHIDTAEGPDLLEVASGTPDSISALSQLLRQNIKAVPVTGALPVPDVMVTSEDVAENLAESDDCAKDADSVKVA